MVTRRTLLGGLAATAAVGLAGCSGGNSAGNAASGSAGGAAKAETTWKLAFNQTEQHPQYKAAVELGKKLAEATSNRYTIEVFANEQLGSQNEVVQNLSDGSVEMMFIGGPVMESFNQDFIVFNLPYVFESPEAQAAVFSDKAVMGDLMKSLESSKKITALAALHAGTRSVYNSKRAVMKPEDLKGLKIRVQQSDSQVKMIESMGAVASPMGQGEVYTALQSGVLDGAENNETVFDALKHDEVAKYYSYTRHLMIPDFLLINSDTLAKMSEEDRKAFLALLPDMQTQANEGFISYAAESKASAEKLGAKFNDDCDIAAFKAATKPLVESSISNDVRKKLFEAAQAANKAHPAK